VYQGQRKGWSAFEALTEPRVAQDWLSWAVVAAAVVSVVGASRTWRLPVVPVLALIVCAAVPARLLWQSVYVRSEWSRVEAVLWLGGLAAAMWIVWMLFHTSNAASDPRVRLVLLLVVTLCTAVVLAMSGVLVYGLFAGATAAALVGTCAWPVVRRDSAADLSGGLAGGGGVLTVLVVGLILLGYFFAELTAINAVLLGLALTAVGWKMPTRLEARPKTALAVRMVTCLVPAAVAVTLAARAFAAAMAEQAADPYW
jgi:hypothetical protein